MLNETKLEDMISIMESLHKYVPGRLHTTSVTSEPGETFDLTDTVCYKILFGGNQLTVAQARRAQVQRKNSSLTEHRLDGFLPIAEDWPPNKAYLW